MSRNEKPELLVGDVDRFSADQSSATSQTQDQTAYEHGSGQHAMLPVHKKEQPLLQQKQTSDPPPAMSLPPNGGRLAWIQVLCGFLLFFNTFGILTSFGVFQTYYESPSSPFQRSSSNISWIGSIQAFLLQFIGLFAGPIYDKGYLRALIAFGSFTVVFGHMMLSIASAYWQILLAQGFCVGLGMGCLYLSSISILPSYFSTRLGLSIGLASSGSAVGGVIYPIVMERLIAEIGFGWTVRVVGFIALVTLSVPVALMHMRLKPVAARALIDWSAFSDVPFLWFAVATSIGFMGINAFQSYFSFYAAQQHITSTAFSFNLVSIYNAMSALGVSYPMHFRINVVYFCTIITHAEGPMIGITVLAGFFLGILTALPPVCFTILTRDKSKIGARIGTGFAIIAAGILMGGPGAGGILQRSSPLDWEGLSIFAGAAMLVAGVMYTVLRVARSGFRPFIKA